MERLRKVWAWITKIMSEIEKAHKTWWEYRTDFINKNGYDPFHSFDDDYNRF